MTPLFSISGMIRAAAAGSVATQYCWNAAAIGAAGAFDAAPVAAFCARAAGTARIVVTKISDIHNGADVGSFKADMDWVDTNGTKVLSEARKMTFRKSPTLRVIDVDLKLTAAGDVTFGDAKDGAFDIIGCGPGRDTVVADPIDLVGSDCERPTPRAD